MYIYARINNIHIYMHKMGTHSSVQVWKTKMEHNPLGPSVECTLHSTKILILK